MCYQYISLIWHIFTISKVQNLGHIYTVACDFKIVLFLMMFFFYFQNRFVDGTSVSFKVTCENIFLKPQKSGIGDTNFINKRKWVEKEESDC